SRIVAIAIPLVAVGLPATEAGLSLARRFVNGQSLFAGDRGHIHHKLLDRGMTQRQAVILLYAVCALFSLFGLMLLNPKRELAALIFFVLGVGIVFGVQQLGYKEFSVLGSQIRQGVTRRRRALAVNVRVRRASDNLCAVKSAEELFAALESMFETEEFDYVLLEINECEPAIASPSTRYRSPESGPLTWTWKRGGTKIENPISTDQCWMLRLPLITDQGE